MKAGTYAGTVPGQQSEDETAPKLLLPWPPVIAGFTPIQINCRVLAKPTSLNLDISLAIADFTLVRSCFRASHGPEHVVGQLQETGQNPRLFQSISSALFPGVSKCVCLLFMKEIWISSDLLLGPLVFTSLKRTRLAGVKPRIRMPNMWFKPITP